jgi:hypothetical protein
MYIKQITGTVEHVIHATGDPDVSIGVPLCAVAGHVVSGKHREIRFIEPLLVVPHRPHHSGPRLLEGNVTLGLSFLDKFRI